ncbi:hypothetical protein DL96DRAFT_1625075, partial [Flagelloscypha sp. PMI_526]
TPRVGTVQHLELEAQVQASDSTMKRIIEDWLIPIAQLLGVTAAIAAYNIGACALGRFFLDHFHIWDRQIPTDASHINKYAELFAALLASCLSTPVAFGLIFMLFIYVDEFLDRLEIKFQFLDDATVSTMIIITFLTEWSLIPVAAAIFHPRFHSVNPVSLLGVYGFGTLVLLPLSILLASFGFVLWRLKN